MTDTAPALAMRGVRKTFEAENAPVRALRGVDLRVGRGEFVALMGPSGCGKSTLLNLVAGLDTPDEGEISVAGEQMTGRGEDDLARLRRQHIGLVFQFFNLLESMTVLENVTLPAVIAGRRRKMAETRARDLLDLLGIGDKSGALPGVLSGGAPARSGTLRRRLVTGILLAATVVTVVAGVRAQQPGALPAVQAVAFALTLAFALAAMVATRDPGLTGQWQLAAMALAGAIALTAARLGSAGPPGGHPARYPCRHRNGGLAGCPGLRTARRAAALPAAGRPEPGASTVAGGGRGSGRGSRPALLGSAYSHRLAGSGRRGGSGRDHGASGRAGHRQQRPGRRCGSHPGPRALAGRVHRRGLGHLPGPRAGAGPAARRSCGPGDPRVVDARRGGGRGRLPAGPVATDDLGHPPRLWRPGGTRSATQANFSAFWWSSARPTGIRSPRKTSGC